MRKTHFLFTVIAALSILYSCKHEDRSPTDQTNSNDSANKELWAEQLESAANITKPEGWSDQDWNSVTKNVDREKIFNTIVESVLSGKQQAYDYITDSAITVEQVKSMLLADAKTNITAGDISLIKVREKWYFDKEKFKLEKQANALSLFVNSYAGDGSVRGYKALFYVKLNN